MCICFHRVADALNRPIYASMKIFHEQEQPHKAKRSGKTAGSHKEVYLPHAVGANCMHPRTFKERPMDKQKLLHRKQIVIPDRFSKKSVGAMLFIPNDM